MNKTHLCFLLEYKLTLSTLKTFGLFVLKIESVTVVKLLHKKRIIEKTAKFQIEIKIIKDIVHDLFVYKETPNRLNFQGKPFVFSIRLKFF